MRCALLTLLCLVCSLQAAETDLRLLVEPIAQQAVDEKKIVGMSIGLYDRGAQHSLHFGRISLAPDAPAPTDETYYEIGSITKTFTGILLADSVARGEVEYDKPLNDYLPDGVRMEEAGRPIQLGELASHFSGMPRMPGNFRPADPTNPYADYAPDRMFAFIQGLKPAREPGEKYEYSNLAVGLLGYILAERSGHGSWESLAKERLLGPLGMHETGLNWTRRMYERMAPGHRPGTLENLYAMQPAANWDIPTFAGAGGLRSTIPDMLRYAQANIHPPVNKLGHAIAESHAQRFSYGDRPGGTALGWHIGAATDFRWHTGRTGGYSSYMAFSSKHELAVIVLGNTSTAEVDAVGEKILGALLRERGSSGE